MFEAATPPDESSPAARSWFERERLVLAVVVVFVLLMIAGCSAMLVGAGGLADGAAQVGSNPTGGALSSPRATGW